VGVDASNRLVATRALPAGITLRLNVSAVDGVGVRSAAAPALSLTVLASSY
jgi:hypothetical protein